MVVGVAWTLMVVVMKILMIVDDDKCGMGERW